MSVSTAFVSSPKLSRVFLGFVRNTVNMFCVSFREHPEKKKGKQLVYFGYQNVNSLCSRHHDVNSLCLFNF